MYSMAAPHAKGKSAEDNIFAANNRAIVLAEKIGTENVVNATVGSILDEDGSLVVLDVVKEALSALTPKEMCAYAPIRDIAPFWMPASTSALESRVRRATSMPVRPPVARACCIMWCITTRRLETRSSSLTGTGARMTA